MDEREIGIKVEYVKIIAISYLKEHRFQYPFLL